VLPPELPPSSESSSQSSHSPPQSTSVSAPVSLLSVQEVRSKSKFDISWFPALSSKVSLNSFSPEDEPIVISHE